MNHYRIVCSGFYLSYNFYMFNKGGMMFKFSTGDLCMITKAPEAFDELNGWVVKLQQASLNCDVESWYTEEEIPNIYSEHSFPIPESWLWKFGTEEEKK